MWADALPRFTPARWAGPALLLLGATAIAVLAATPRSSRGTVEAWVLGNALSAEHVLPLIGLGIALGLSSRWSLLLGLAAFGLGLAAGGPLQPAVLSLTSGLSRAADHLFLTGPVSLLAMGLALIAPDALRRVLLPFSAVTVGAMQMIAIKLTDPSFHDPMVTRFGIAVAFWIPLAIALTGQAFRRPYFPIGARILGSWLLAIGCLYGASTLVPRKQVEPPVPPPAPAQQTPTFAPPGAGPAFDGLFSDAPTSHDRSPLGQEMAP